MIDPTTNPLSIATLRDQLYADLDFHGSDGRHSTHGWHPFPAKFPPQLPGYFIERLSRPGEVVFDPMFGSGTTILEAVRLRRNAIGCDIDPLARLIAEAKLSPITPLTALRLGGTVVSKARRSCALERPRIEDALAERGIDVETHKGLAAVATSAGFQLAHIGVRRLDRDKRMMPARWGNGGQSQIEQRMHEEHVIGLLK